MNGVKTALTRKFGPLPAWAWALIAGAAIYIFRTRKSLGSTGAQVAAQTDAPLAPLAPDSGSGVGSGGTGGGSGGGASDIGAGGNPLIGTDPAQLPPDRQLLDPITLEPGESVYDPNSGNLFTPGAKPKAKTKRAKKAKPHHAPTKGVPKGGHHKTRTRSVAKTLTGRKKKGTGGAHNPKHGGKPRKGATPTAPRPRAHARPNPRPVQRQRPAPQHTSTPKPRHVQGSPGKVRTPANPPRRRKKR